MDDRLSGSDLNDKSVGCISDFANLRFAAVRPAQKEQRRRLRWGAARD